MRKSYLEKEIYDESYSLSGYKKYITMLLIFVAAVVIIVSGCAPQNSKGAANKVPPTPPAPVSDNNVQRSEVGAGNDNIAKANDKKREEERDTRMVSFDIQNVGRSNPFMPYAEYQAYEQAKRDALNEANEHNARISRIKSLQGQKIREEDDISPYSFNLPVPPTSLAGEGSTAVKITKTKVVGIMYNSQSPSAIINIDNKDYLVRPGDKIIDEQYIVDKINKSYITVSMGANVYSAAIGELFSEDRLETNQTDLYNIEHRFGGRKG